MVLLNQEITLIGQDFPVFLSNQNKENKVLCPDGKAPYPGCWKVGWYYPLNKYLSDG